MVHNDIIMGHNDTITDNDFEYIVTMDEIKLI